MRLGGTQILANKHLDAMQTFLAATRLAPQDPSPWVGYVFSCLHASEWAEYARLVAKTEKMLSSPSKEIQPFSVLSFSDDPATLLRCSKRYAGNFKKSDNKPPPPRVANADDRSRDKIRIAYFSSDFKIHATMLLATGLFEHHDRKRFETYAIAWAPDESLMRRRAEAAFDHFIDVTTAPDDGVAKLIRDRQIDILIDLHGYTGKARPAVLVDRPAPIQVNYLGYPGTMGADWIDYLIADRFVVPPDAAQFYSEKLVYLPGSYQANDNRRAEPGTAPPRANLGLPEQGFVFACFNANNKITPDVFAIWMRLLKRSARQRSLAPGSRRRCELASGGGSCRCRCRAAGFRAKNTDSRAYKAAAVRRSIPRYLAVQCAYDRQRCAVGRRPGCDLPGTILPGACGRKSAACHAPA